MSRSDHTKICHRCKTQQATVTIRQDALCRDCFLRYVYSKTVKRMETVRDSSIDAQKSIVLPLSFGPSSTTLLAVLDQHLNNRFEKSGRRPYTIRCLHVIDDSESAEHEYVAELLDKVKTRFPHHTYDSIPLSSAASDSTDASADALSDPSRSLHSLLSNAASPTDEVDIKTRLLTKAVVAYAQANNCDGIVWGDSTTRLAERTMSEAGKGRGGALPSLLSESSTSSNAKSPSSSTPSNSYPLRDLLRKELRTYCDLSEPPLTELLQHQGVSVNSALSARNSTIDSLMTTYFESVEKDYPSIVTNVVRTISKLKVPDDTDSDPKT